MPTDSVPLWMRPAPAHTTATPVRCSTAITAGMFSAIKRPARSAVPVSSSLARAKRERSASSRTKARMTRRPLICSRKMPLILSSWACMRPNRGIARAMSEATTNASRGTATSSRPDKRTSCCMAIATPPMPISGASMITVRTMASKVCNCSTSLVQRVIRDGTPKRCTSTSESECTWAKSTPRRSRPASIAMRAPSASATSDKPSCTNAASSIQPPNCPIRRVSCRATPWSMSSALRCGNSRAASVCPHWQASTNARRQRYGRSMLNQRRIPCIRYAHT